MLEVAQNSTPTVEAYPSTAKGVSSATATVYAATGGQLQTGSATVDSVSTAVAAASSVATQFTVASATGIAAGRRYLLGMQELATLATVERIASATVTLVDIPAGTIRASDTFRGMRLTYALTTASTAARGKHFRVEWDITHTDGSTSREQSMFHVCAMPLGDVVRIDDVAAALRAYGTSQNSRFTPGTMSNIAAWANDEIVRAIERHDRYPHLYGSRDPFASAGRAAIRMVLAREFHLLPASAGGDLEGWIVETERQFTSAHAQAVAGLQWYDADDSRTVEAQERRRLRFSELRL